MVSCNAEADNSEEEYLLPLLYANVALRTHHRFISISGRRSEEHRAVL